MEQMKLSEAILKGCEVTKPWAGEYISDELGFDCTCTLGAVKFGFPISDYQWLDRSTLETLYPELKNYVKTGQGQRLLHDVITRLNDKSQLTREQIAQWLARKYNL